VHRYSRSVARFAGWILVVAACTPPAPAERCKTPAADALARAGGVSLTGDEYGFCSDEELWERLRSQPCAALAEPLCPDGAANTCTQQADCAADEQCLLTGEICGCVPIDCAADDDCDPEEACVCGAIDGDGGYLRRPRSCVHADCRAPGDCDASERCALSADSCEVQGFFCKAAAVPDGQCAGAGACDDIGCTWSGDAWVCSSSYCNLD
jgi:hypothetical protein